MATLNDLRTKGGWIIAVIVAIAMVAFLLGDFINSGSSIINERKTRVGEINGDKVGYATFYNRVEELQDIYRMLWGTSAFSNDQQEAIYDGVWQQFLMESVYEPGFKKLGVGVSDAEQVDMVNGVYLSPIITSMFSDPTTGAFNDTYLKAFLAGVSSNEQYSTVWNFLKNQMIEEREMSNYVGLVSAAFEPNDLEINRQVAASNESASGKFISVYYSAIADSLVMGSITDNDVKKYYNEHKELYKQEASRMINYVIFDVIPTDADYEEAAKTVAELAAEFAETQTPLQYATLNSQQTVDSKYYKESELPSQYVSYAFGADKGKMYGPVLTGDIYTMARLTEIRNMPDSLSARHILLSAADQSKADSLLTLLRQGADFATLANEYSVDTAANADGGNLGTFAPEEMVSDFSDACLDAKVGEYFTVNTSYGTHIVQVTSKSAATPKAQFATIVYTVDPSEATQQDVYNKASNFLIATDNTLDGFTAAVSSEGLAAQTAVLSTANHVISGFDNSKELVRWAFNGKKGDVSSILDIDDKYVVAVLSEVAEPGYAPVKQVASLITNTLKNEAKVKYVADEVAGLSMEDAAAKLGTEVSEVSGVQFASYIVNGLGIEPRFVGAFSNSKAGAAPAIVEGVSSVIVYQVDDTASSEATDYDAAKVYLQSYGAYYLDSRLSQAIADECTIVDNRAKYF